MALCEIQLGSPYPKPAGCGLFPGQLVGIDIIVRKTNYELDGGFYYGVNWNSPPGGMTSQFYGAYPMGRTVYVAAPGDADTATLYWDNWGDVGRGNETHQWTFHIDRTTLPVVLGSECQYTNCAAPPQRTFRLSVEVGNLPTAWSFQLYDFNDQPMSGGTINSPEGDPQKRSCTQWAVISDIPAEPLNEFGQPTGPAPVKYAVLTVSNPNGTITSSPIGIGVPGMDASTLGADRTTILPGESAVLSWSIGAGATRATLNGELIFLHDWPRTGTKTVSPSTNTVYTLEVWGQGCEPALSTVTIMTGVAGWLPGYRYRKRIDLQQDNLSDSLSLFPLLVQFSDTDIGSHAVDGNDICFADVTGLNPIGFERESFTVSEGVARGTFWVVTDLLKSGTHLYIFYGKYGAEDGSQAVSVWDPYYKLVWHMGDNPSNANQILDSTINHNHGTKQGEYGEASSYPSETDGIVAKAQNSPNHGWVQSANAIGITGNAPRTLSAWGKIGSWSDPGCLVGWGDSCSDRGVSYLTPSVGNAGKFAFWAYGLDVPSSVTSTDNAWHYVCATYDGTTVRLYVDGVQAATASGPLSSSDGCVYSGREPVSMCGWSSNGTYAHGVLDEVRVSSVCRSAAWIAFEYHNIHQADHELTWSAEEASPDAGQVGFLDGWSYRRKITVQTDKLDSSLSSFPLYVSFTNDAHLGAHARSDGYDLRFTAADGLALLPYERESFSVASGQATGNFWVKTNVATSGTEIYLYYGNASASEGQNKTAVWDANYKLVWHMDNNPSNSSQVLDSTSNANYGTRINSPGEVNAKMGKGQETNGSSSYVQSSQQIGITGGEQRTLGIWCKVSSVSNAATLLGWGSGYQGGQSWLKAASGENGNVFGWWGWGGPGYDMDTNATSTDGNWHQFVGTIDGSGLMALYVDGTRKATQQSYLNSPNGYVCAGAGTAWNAYVGAILDEARISKVARTAAWIKFEYWNLQSADHELTWGDVESPGQAASLLRRTLFLRSGTRTSMAI